ncbi:MAG: hypothetical protein HY541_02035 [Deltaproteobacteria bacterium]|nr:hypothetical protein [Deltaproteobacteria bacterium]
MRPRGLSLSAFVRDILEDAVKRKRMAESAGKYTAFLKDHPDEEAWLDDWDAADLARPPSRKKGS